MQQIGKGGLGKLPSVLSNLSTNLNAENPLVKQIQEKTGIEDSQKVTGYTQQAVDLIKQESIANPEGIESLLKNVVGDTDTVGDIGGEVKKGIVDRLKEMFR